MTKVIPLTEDKKIDYKWESFGGWVLREMSKRKLSQKEVAGWLGVSQQALSLKCSGETDFKLKEILILFKKFETTDERIVTMIGWGYGYE